MTYRPVDRLFEDVLRWLRIGVQLIALLDEVSAAGVLHSRTQKRIILSHDAFLERLVA